MAKKKNAKEARENKKKELLAKHAESRRQQMEMNQQKQQAAQRPAPSESNAADDGMPTLEEQLKRVPRNSFPPVRLPEHPLAKSKEIRFDEFTLEVAALSPSMLRSCMTGRDCPTSPESGSRGSFMRVRWKSLRCPNWQD